MSYEDYLLRIIRDHGGCPNLLTKEEYEYRKIASPEAWWDVQQDCAQAAYNAGKKSVPAE